MPEPPPSIPSPITPDCTPTWFKRLKPEFVNTEDLRLGKSEPAFQETILIGLGEAGREVVSQVALTLQAQYGNQWKSKIRELQVDSICNASGQGEAEPPLGLKQDEWVLLEPNLREIQKNLTESPEDWKHWQWYLFASQDGRASGRAALFYDLKDGKTNSKLWNSMEKACLSLTLPVVRIIGTTFDSVSSGMLVDLVHLIPIIAQRDLDVQLWLFGPFLDNWDDADGTSLSVNEQSLRALATLRELERFQRNASVRFDYVSRRSFYDQLRQTTDHNVVGTIMLFEQNIGETPQETVDAMVDSLMPLLYSSVNMKVSKHLSDTRRFTSDLVQREGRGVAAVSGTYSLQLASGLLENAMAWRMVQDLLFEEEFGLYPQDRCNMNTGEYEHILGISTKLDTGYEQDKLIGWVSSCLQKSCSEEAFAANIALRLSQILNGETDSDEIKSRRAALDLAEKWGRLLLGAVRDHPRFIQPVKTLEQEITRWKRWFIEEVHVECEFRLQTSHNQLERLRKKPRRESDVQESLEWAAYSEMVRPAPKDRHLNQPVIQPLRNMAQRFGWYVSYNTSIKEWSIDLVLPPHKFGWQAGSEPGSYAISRNKRRLLDLLYEMCLPAVQVGAGPTAPEVALRRDFRTWLEKSKPHISGFIAQAFVVIVPQ